MKIIDLLNKIANGEKVPKKLNYMGETYLKTQYDDTQNVMIDYLSGESENAFFDTYNISSIINDEVEIIEEEKGIPEKLSTWFSLEMSHSKELNREYANTNFENMYEKINEICDYLKSKGDE